MDVNATTSRIDAPPAATPRTADRPHPEPKVEQHARARAHAEDAEAHKARAHAEDAEGRKARAEAATRSDADLKFTLRSADVEAKFTLHEATNQVTVTIRDRKTGEVIREIPSKERLDLVAALAGKGNLLDESR